MIAKPILVRSFGRTSQLAAVSCLALGLNSCIPLAVGAAVGYVAREEGVGVVRPAGSDRGVYVDPPTHEEMEEYEEYQDRDYHGQGYGYGYDEPVY